MMKKIPVVVIPGDGIGPEITSAMQAVVDASLDISHEVKIEWQEANAGLSALTDGVDLLPNITLDLIRRYKLAIKGPTATPIGGGHRSVNVALRKELDLYANFRPIRWYKGIDTPIRRPEQVRFSLFREATEDVYAGIEFAAGTREAEELALFLHLSDRIVPHSALGIKPVSEFASRRIMRRALQFAVDQKANRVTIVHKGNIMKFTEGAFAAWCRQEAQAFLGERYLSEEQFSTDFQGSVPDGKIVIQERIADAMFQEILLRPERHEVIVSMNLNGDYLSDAAAALVGGLGMAPGANLGDDLAVFEAVHGTAPDIAGKNLANPSALILSSALLLDHVGAKRSALLIREAIQ
ncbi:MAG: hypothetical protein KDD60_08495, partial [Bdellovibrionales bacterium]|nr:hypothetical protein [Bdellovibrionales bacterium]